MTIKETQMKTVPEQFEQIELEFRAIFADSSDVVFRNFLLGGRKQRALLLFIDGLAGKNILNENIMRPLLLAEEFFSAPKSVSEIASSVLETSDVKKTDQIKEIVAAVLGGDSTLLVEGSKEALLIDTREWEKRGVSEPGNEVVVRGPREGFIEALRINTSLLRRKIHHPDLKMEYLKSGRYSQTDICIAYVKGIASENLVKEVRRRVEHINIDGILESGYVEQLIEDAPFSLFPTIGNSEKPDTVAAKLLEGRVAILIDGTPIVLTVPLLMVELFQSAEDYFSRPWFSSFVRFFRFIAFAISILLPAFYVAISSFHQEVLPNSLMITIAAAEENTPFPVAVSVFMMLLIYEMLREAGLRLPRAAGQAISIVGGLVLGDAAIRAGLVSTPIVIVVALTIIASFVVSPLSDTAGLLRLLFIIASAIFGSLGITLGILFLLLHLLSIESFGAPYLFPIGPLGGREMRDTFIRAPMWMLNKRPRYISRYNETRQGPHQKPPPGGKESEN